MKRNFDSDFGREERPRFPAFSPSPPLLGVARGTFRLGIRESTCTSQGWETALLPCHTTTSCMFPRDEALDELSTMKMRGKIKYTQPKRDDEAKLGYGVPRVWVREEIGHDSA